MCARERHYDLNATISYREGILKTRMAAYKFNGKSGWALIFARILLGFLADNMLEYCSYDLVVASPSFTPRRAPARTDDPGFIVTTGATIDQVGWDLDGDAVPAVIKTAATTPMKNKSWKQREEIATTELRHVLEVPDVSRTRGKRILVFDDLYTTGHTLNEVARCLSVKGRATQVTGISLARQIKAD